MTMMPLSSRGHARAGDAARSEGRIVAEADTPLDGRLVQVVLHDRCVRRLDAVADGVVLVDHGPLQLRNAVRIGGQRRDRVRRALPAASTTEPDPAINSGGAPEPAGAPPRPPRPPPPWRCTLSASARRCCQKRHDVIDVSTREVRQRRHPSFACPDDRADCCRVKARRTGHDVVRRIGRCVDEWRRTAFRSQPVRAVARLAVLLIDSLPGGQGWRRRRAATTAPGVLRGTHADGGCLDCRARQRRQRQCPARWRYRRRAHRHCWSERVRCLSS